MLCTDPHLILMQDRKIIQLNDTLVRKIIPINICNSVLKAEFYFYYYFDNNSNF